MPTRGWTGLSRRWGHGALTPDPAPVLVLGHDTSDGGLLDASRLDSQAAAVGHAACGLEAGETDIVVERIHLRRVVSDGPVLVGIRKRPAGASDSSDPTLRGVTGDPSPWFINSLAFLGGVPIEIGVLECGEHLVVEAGDSLILKAFSAAAVPGIEATIWHRRTA